VKVAVLGNCQARSLAAALAHLSPGIEATPIVWSTIHDEAAAEGVRDSLAAYDLVLAQPYKKWRALRPKIIARFSSRSALYPRFYFDGLHPDALLLGVEHGLGFQFGVWHSALAMAAFLRGVPAREAADLYNAYIYGVLGYFDAYAAAEALQIDAGGEHGVDLTAAFAGWRGQVFANTPSHPRLAVGLAIAAQLAPALGLPVAPVGPLPADPLTGGFIFPVYPEIGRKLGLEGDLVFRNAGRDDAVGLEQMLSESFAAYGFAPAAIAALPRVVAAAEVLRQQGV
jgi:hypothetical protein